VSRTHQPTRRFTYDALNRVTKDSLDGYPATLYAYEDSLHLTKVTDPKAQVYRFVYNAVGWPIAEFDPANRADSLFYSLDGEVRRWKNRRNQVITYTYDVLHRPLATNAAGVADTLSYRTRPG
jgi:YD repeat-containing protein